MSQERVTENMAPGLPREHARASPPPPQAHRHHVAPGLLGPFRYLYCSVSCAHFF